MQHDDGRRFGRRRTDHAVFEIGSADGEGACGGKGHTTTLKFVMPGLVPGIHDLTRRRKNVDGRVV